MSVRSYMATLCARWFPPFRRRQERIRRALERERLDNAAFAAMLPILEEINAIVVRSDGPPAFTPRDFYQDDTNPIEPTEFDEVLARLEPHVLSIRHPANILVRDMLENIILNTRYHNTYFVSAVISHVNDRIGVETR
jgi:hypothetical protein